MSIVTGGQCAVPIQVPGLLLWYDANDVNGDGSFISNNTPIATWVDKSGSKLNANQPVGSQQPLLMTNIQAGKPGLLFDRIDSQSFDTDSITLSADMTIFVTLLSESTDTLSVFDISTVYLPEFNLDSGNNQYGGGNYDGSANRGFLWADSTTFDPHILVYRYDSSNTGVGQMFIDNTTYVAFSNDNVSAVSTGGRRIAGHPTANVWFDGYIFEIMLYRGALSDNQITFLSKYLGNKWGIASL